MSDGHERRLSDLYRASAREEPPALIDDMILAEARREARGSTRIASRWGIPLALAAVLVLSVSLVTLMRDTSELSGENSSAERQRPTSPAAPGTDGLGVAVKESEQRRDTALQKRAKTEPTSDGVADSARLDRVQAEGASTPGTTRHSTGRVAVPARTVPTPPASVAAPAAVDPAPSPDRLRSEVTKSAASQPAPIQAPSKARANAYSATDAPGGKSDRAEASTAERSSHGPAEAVVPEKAPQAGAIDDDTLGPEQWLKRIEGLRKAGKATEAQESLDAFRKRFPTYPLPATLK